MKSKTNRKVSITQKKAEAIIGHGDLYRLTHKRLCELYVAMGRQRFEVIIYRVSGKKLYYTRNFQNVQNLLNGAAKLVAVFNRNSILENGRIGDLCKHYISNLKEKGEKGELT